MGYSKKQHSIQPALTDCSAVHLTTDYRRLTQIKANKTKSVKIRVNQWLSGFSLVELMIVTAILGILAAIVLPVFQGHVQQAKESAAKDNLRILRNAIEVYAAQHNDVPPGYLLNKTSLKPSHWSFYVHLVTGSYLNALPKNPFNEQVTIMIVSDNDPFPENPSQTDLYGWVYKAKTKTIKLNWSGTDSEGIRYYDY
ncbi:MAG: type II secretion system protein [Phycisphaerae bacterium]|nr:type II secretion system protein [Phycisphaerae bacterium]